MPFTRETVEVRKFVSDVTGTPITLADTDPDPEPFKWPAAKDLPKLFGTDEEYEALSAFLTGNPEPLKALYATKPATTNGSKSGSGLAAIVRAWLAANPNVKTEDSGRGRVSADAYLAYFKANPDATLPDGSTEPAAKAYAEARKPAEPAAS